MSPLVLDHVFTESHDGKTAWANVHAFDHGELLTGQMRLVHKTPYVPPPPPEKSVDLDGVLHGVVDEAIASAFAKVLSEPPAEPLAPAPPSLDAPVEEDPDRPVEGETKDGYDKAPGSSRARRARGRRKLVPVENPATHLPWEEENIERWHQAWLQGTPAPTSPPPAALPSDQKVAAEIAEQAEAAEREERGEEEEVTAKESAMACKSSIYSESGCCCEIPFSYGGMEHTNCTLMDHTAFWCYVEEEGCGARESATGKWWDHCWPAPEEHKEPPPPRTFKRKHHKRHKPGRYCAQHGHHTQPWHYNSFCNDDEVCNFRCKDLRCAGKCSLRSARSGGRMGRGGRACCEASKRPGPAFIFLPLFFRGALSAAGSLS